MKCDSIEPAVDGNLSRARSDFARGEDLRLKRTGFDPGDPVGPKAPPARGPGARRTRAASRAPATPGARPLSAGATTPPRP
ncbi:hypothetical protein [Burkholderia pseudomallei]|uniref:hypothetical protein n=1 Tax=Burkholderia pseudomallei TaxID=28450 RepID=UPI00014F874A|nr:hypothetical protein [Burkholderia pseudomallei]EBA50801.1 hypothetical protein BURPS305_7194 [Burkholderia pseudomallei 305]APZ19669.1 hypothetical protein BGI47_14080 [Burkholderia pseudomallei]APZ25862.1 hypothetical protein BGI46_14090 [Burkholderia pseudomallei]OMT60640.1 hypothetical protein AQ760_01110 [Burkholderia pseudomallei]OMZ24929.1 hypothetical protein AQ859_27400 [Burkholderia pseudomallei]